MRLARLIPLVMLVALSLAACGSGNGASQVVVVRIAGVPITQGELTRQKAVLAGGRSSSSVPRSRSSLSTRALEELIASRWTLAEAAEEDLAPSYADVRARVEARRTAEFPGGMAEWRAFLKQAGQTVGGVELEARTEMSAQALRNEAVKFIAPVAPAEVAAYYRAHRRRYAVPLRREIEITNRKTAALAERVKREVAAGRSFASLATREIVALPSWPGEPYARDHLDPAIAAAKLGILSGPVKQRVDYFVFEVKRVEPASYEPLAKARAAIAAQLTAERHHRAEAGFLSEWQARWRAKTTCARGHVVRGCSEDASSRMPEARFELP